MLNNFWGRFLRKAYTIFGARVKNRLFIKNGVNRCLLETKEDQEPNPVALQIYQLPRRDLTIMNDFLIALVKIVSRKFKSFTQYVFNLNKNPWYHTLSKALEISKNIPLTSCVRSQSKEELISWAIDNNWNARIAW